MDVDVLSFEQGVHSLCHLANELMHHVDEFGILLNLAQVFVMHLDHSPLVPRHLDQASVVPSRLLFKPVSHGLELVTDGRDYPVQLLDKFDVSLYLSAELLLLIDKVVNFVLCFSLQTFCLELDHPVHDFRLACRQLLGRLINDLFNFLFKVFASDHSASEFVATAATHTARDRPESLADHSGHFAALLTNTTDPHVAHLAHVGLFAEAGFGL